MVIDNLALHILHVPGSLSVWQLKKRAGDEQGLSVSVATEKAGGRRVGSLCQCGRLKKRAGEEQGLVEKKGAQESL